MELEWLATNAPPAGAYPFDFAIDPAGEAAPVLIDIRRMIAAIANDLKSDFAAATISRKFHSTLVETISTTCAKIAQRTGIDATSSSAAACS